MEYGKIRAMISGGGTGGHIFPAISIADRLKAVNPGNEILFVGAEGRMEMEKVPAAGYTIKGLSIAGLQRKLTPGNILRNIKLPWMLIRSVKDAASLIDGFKPDVVIGVGGYASAPLLYAAQRKGVPTLIQEQNGFAGLTNKILGKRAGKICVAYEGMERFFPEDRIVLTGNPIRQEVASVNSSMRDEAIGFYGLNPERRHILIIGGSLGSKTLNDAMCRWIEKGCPGGENADVLWQCGKYYKKGIDSFMASHKNCVNVKYSDFIKRMDLAYAAADVTVSRSGASSISEICAARKAAVLVPSPNVAEDHQTHNAMALVRKGAAMMVRDCDAAETLMDTALALAKDSVKLAVMGKNAGAMAMTEASTLIVNEIYKLTENVQ